MTGNTVLLGIAAVRFDRGDISATAGAIASFFVGCMAAQWLRSPRRIVGFAVEGVLLLGASFLARYPAQLDVLAFTMGVHNTNVSDFANVKANTSFITGNYDRLAKAAASILRGTPDAAARNTVVVIVPLLLSYAFGALCAGGLIEAAVSHVLLVPIVVLAAVYVLITRSGKAVAPEIPTV
jgi:uncharacterized membrane protein YoaK (UPF0700 family)